MVCDQIDPEIIKLNDSCLPNGHTRQEYSDAGFSAVDIEYWGLNQPGAPDPLAAGFVSMDMMDGNFEGEIDF